MLRIPRTLITLPITASLRSFRVIVVSIIFVHTYRPSDEAKIAFAIHFKSQDGTITPLSSARIFFTGAICYILHLLFTTRVDQTNNETNKQAEEKRKT